MFSKRMWESSYCLKVSQGCWKHCPFRQRHSHRSQDIDGRYFWAFLPECRAIAWEGPQRVSWAASQKGAGSTCPRTTLLLTHLQQPMHELLFSSQCFQGSGAPWKGRLWMRKTTSRTESEQDKEREKAGRNKGLKQQKEKGKKKIKPQSINGWNRLRGEKE